MDMSAHQQHIEQRLLIVRDEEVYNSDEYIF